SNVRTTKMTQRITIACLLITSLTLGNAIYAGVAVAQVRSDDEANFPAEGAVLEADWSTYLLGNSTASRNLRLGVSNDGYTRAEIKIENNNTAHGNIYFKTNETGGGVLTRMSIKSDGNVGIGTTTPQAKLAV